jgi:SAM-dependent methyltransferase
MKLSSDISSKVRCPGCLNELELNEFKLECKNPECKSAYPIVNDVPILIYEKESIFRIQDFIDHKDTTFKHDQGKLHAIARKFTPSISNNIKAKQNYKKLDSELASLSPNPNVLVIGGSIIGVGMDDILQESSINLIESDISFGPRTQIVFDAHNIPFPNNFFDGVIIQAVLEHVVDPFKCVAEVHRVLKSGGLVYAETPFMQQVHMGKYDFHRFSHLGHRRLFSHFSEIESGAICGPGMALAWAYSHFIFSFFSSKKMRKFLIPFTSFTSFFWKYFDYILIDKPGTLDAASGYFFLGSKSESILDDRELLKQYRGLL